MGGMLVARRAVVPFALSIAVLIGAAAPPAFAAQWHFSDAANVDAFSQETAAAAFAGKVHVFYGDASSRVMKHAWRDLAGWHHQALNDPGPWGEGDTMVWGPVSATVAYNQLHVFYRLRDEFSSSELRHAWSGDGVHWTFEGVMNLGRIEDGTVVDIGTPDVTSMLLNQQLHVFAGNGRLQHAWYDPGGSWHHETLDRRTTVTRGISAAVVGGRAHVFYVKDVADGQCDLRHAWYDGGWHYEILDGDRLNDARTLNQLCGATSAVVLSGLPHVFYHDSSRGFLRHTWFNGAEWGHETLDGNSTLDGRTRQPTGSPTAVVFGGRPHIFYQAARTLLRHAWFNGTRWAFETLATNNANVVRSSVVVGTSLHAFYLRERVAPFDYALVDAAYY